MMKKAPRIIISGGGTGGHIFPALSIAKAIMQRDSNAEILFVGAHNRMEMEKVPAAGFNIVGLPVTGLQRSLSFKNLMFLPKLFISVLKCKSIIKSFKPNVVIGVGGYASGPLLYKAQRMKIPTLIQEQNSYAGLTNKWLAGKAKKICVAYENMDRYFPKRSIILTGNPVRKDLQAIDSKSEEASKHFDLNPDMKTLLVIGGSLGARTINKSIAANLDMLIRKKVQVIWQTGKYYYDQAQKELAEYSNHNIKVHQFINRMDLAYASANYIVSRAGAGSISELCIVGKPTILVPSPNVAEDHQTKNAMALVEKGAALLVHDKDAPKILISELFRLMSDDKQMVRFGVNIKDLAKPEADELIVDQVYKLIK